MLYERFLDKESVGLFILYVGYDARGQGTLTTSWSNTQDSRLYDSLLGRFLSEKVHTPITVSNKEEAIIYEQKGCAISPSFLPNVYARHYCN